MLTQEEMQNTFLYLVFFKYGVNNLNKNGVFLTMHILIVQSSECHYIFIL